MLGVSTEERAAFPGGSIECDTRPDRRVKQVTRGAWPIFPDRLLLLEKGLQKPRPGSVPETQQGLFLDLSNSLSGDAEQGPDFLESHRFLIVQSEVQPEDFRLTLPERGKSVFHTVLERVSVGVVFGPG